jgi:hypothetical protein
LTATSAKRQAPTSRAVDAVDVVQSPAHWVAGRGFRPLDAATRSAVVAGRRVILVGGQVQLVDAQAVDDLGSPCPVPAALGGGYLFVGKHSVRFAPTFAGPLVMVATAAGNIWQTRVGIGHKCVLVTFNDNKPTLYGIPTGEPLPLVPPGLSELFGTPQGMVAARVGSALYVSTVQQSQWKKVPSPPINRLGYDGKGIVVETNGNSLRLGFDGKLVALPNGPGMVAASNPAAFEAKFPDPSEPPPEPTDAERLVNPFVRVMDQRIAIGIEGNALLFLDSESGRILRAIPNAFGGRPNCFMIRGGKPSFAGCNANSMSLFRIDSTFAAPVLERSIRGVLSQDFSDPAANAPLVFSGHCDGSKDKTTFCVRTSIDQWKESSLPNEQRKMADMSWIVHVTTSKEGMPYAFGWLDADAVLVIVDGASAKVRHIPTSRIGQPPVNVDWYSVTIESGTIRFLVSNNLGRGKAEITEILPDDSVRTQVLDGWLAPLGPRALHATRDGKLYETLDAGKSFHEVEPPPGGMPDLADGSFGCWEAGCFVGPWQRVGWGVASPSFSTATDAAATVSALSREQMQNARALPACPCPGNAEALTNLWTFKQGTRYVADVQQDEKSGDWRPTPFPAMPYHHSSSIEWDGLERFPKLDESLRLSFTGIATSKQIQKVPGAYRWWATYKIKLECICSHR